MRLPRCLANADLLAWLEAMDEQLRVSGGTGSFGVRWHYADGEPRVVKIEAPEQTFVLPRALDSEPPAVQIALRAVVHATSGKDLTPGDSRS